MAYVDQNNRRERTLSAAASALLVAGIGYALVSGLAVKIIRVPLPDLTLHNYSADTPPPPPRPLPHPRSPTVARLPVTPPIVAPIPSTPDTPLILTPIPNLPPIWTPPVDSHPASTATASADQTVSARPRGTPADWVTTDDYPALAERAGQQGRTGFRLDLSADGRVLNCTVTQSSGSAELDDTACRMLRKRARFTPGRDAAGNPVASNYASSVVWKLPGD